MRQLPCSICCEREQHWCAHRLRAVGAAAQHVQLGNVERGLQVAAVHGQPLGHACHRPRLRPHRPRQCRSAMCFGLSTLLMLPCLGPSRAGCGAALVPSNGAYTAFSVSLSHGTSANNRLKHRLQPRVARPAATFTAALLDCWLNHGGILLLPHGLQAGSRTTSCMPSHASSDVASCGVVGSEAPSLTPTLTDRCRWPSAAERPGPC